MSHHDTVPLTSGGTIPLVGFGTWRLEGQDAYQATRDALELGYRHLDTATMYGNETEVGRALADSGLDRDRVFVTTKCPPDYLGQERKTLEASLRYLGTEYVDLWLVHWPPGDEAHPEMWEQFVALQQEGKARAIGVSNYATTQIDELVATTGVAPSVNQIPWAPSLFDPVRVADLARREVVLEGYSPLRRSDLHDPVLTTIAEAHGLTPAQVVLRWHVEHGFVVIPKSARRSRIEENFAVTDAHLDPDDVARIDHLGAAA